jgi:hypothetical protein
MATLEGFRRERTSMGSQAARVVVEVVEDMVRMSCWEDNCGDEERVSTMTIVALEAVVCRAV